MWAGGRGEPKIARLAKGGGEGGVKHQGISYKTDFALSIEEESVVPKFPSEAQIMASSYFNSALIIAFFVVFLHLISTAAAAPANSNTLFSSNKRSARGQLIGKKKTAQLGRSLNKPSNKTIQAFPSNMSTVFLDVVVTVEFFFSCSVSEQSPDGDIIDCIPSHLQPAFDHPKLMGQAPLEPPERPKGHAFSGEPAPEVQTWRRAGEECPEGTIAVRRTMEKDILRAKSIQSFGVKKAVARRRDSTGSGHEHAIGYANGDYYGAKASFSVWAPSVATPSELSLSQIWVISGSFGADLNTIEAGWQDPKHGHWWLEFGPGLLIGYWPSSLFSHLAWRGTMIQFGGEIFNARTSSFHTSTQMGSGRFAGEEFRRAAYFRNLQVVDSGNSLIPLSTIRVLADHPTCYDIRAGVNVEWGNYFYYGGPGKNVHCP
ncbi:hypothetical protein KSP40_PGU022837 [Platanthera guangdongensis]|uniref:Neprosin PEP catalytic domain-containing protein n=1 Tax=Platanthera guangdongensis TaxID=2320717 RepID=A0ABR2MCT4_9ASPA